MTGRYGTRFGFEFTPTPAGFATMECPGSLAARGESRSWRVLVEVIGLVHGYGQEGSCWESGASLGFGIDLPEVLVTRSMSG